MLVAIGNGSFVTGSGDEIPHPPHRRIRSWSTGAGDRLFGAQRASAGGRRLTLREAKKLLGAIQQRMVEQQVEEYLETQRRCPHCGRARGVKGSHTVMFQTLFGNLELLKGQGMQMNQRVMFFSDGG